MPHRLSKPPEKRPRNGRSARKIAKLGNRGLHSEFFQQLIGALPLGNELDLARARGVEFVGVEPRDGEVRTAGKKNECFLRADGIGEVANRIPRNRGAENQAKGPIK